MKQLLLSALLLAPGLLAAQAPVPFTLKGTIGQLDAPAKIYLLRGGRFTDSTALKNGAFELKGTTDLPQGAMLLLARNGNLKQAFRASPERLMVFLEPTPVTISSRDSLANATAKGGPLTADHERMQQMLAPVWQREKELGAAYQNTPEQTRKTPEFIQRNNAQFEALGKQREQILSKFIQANPNSWVSFDALKQVSGFVPQYAVVAPLYAGLGPALKNSPAGKEYAQLLARIKAVAIGAQAPEFSQLTADGKRVSLRDYRGKYVLVDFWASWCGPCREENPNVIEAYNTYKGRNFDILGVSLDDEKGRAKWLKAIDDDHLTWTQVSDLKGWQNEVARLYQVQGIPQNYLIDPSGKIIAANLRGPELKAALARYLK